MSRLFAVDLATRPVLLRIHSLSQSSFPGYNHYHHGLELLFVHEGAGSVTVNERVYDLQPGSLYIFQPNQTHRVDAVVSPRRPYRRTVVKFDPVKIAPFIQPFPNLLPMFSELWRGQLTSQCALLGQDHERLISYLQDQGHLHSLSRHEQAESFSIFLLSLLDRLRIKYRDQLFVRSASSSSGRYCKWIMKWLEEHLAEPFRLDDLAESLHLSKHHVSRLFKAETGSSIQHYLTILRIRRACWLLQTTEWSVDRVSEAVGLVNSSYFCSLFKKQVGQSPLQYRKQAATRRT